MLLIPPGQIPKGYPSYDRVFLPAQLGTGRFLDTITPTPPGKWSQGNEHLANEVEFTRTLQRLVLLYYNMPVGLGLAIAAAHDKNTRRLLEDTYITGVLRRVSLG